MSVKLPYLNEARMIGYYLKKRTKYKIWNRHYHLPSHLEKAGSTVRIMFFNISSALNNIQPMLVRDKLECTGVDHHLTA